MSTPAPTAHSGWKITGQTQKQWLPAGGQQFITGVEVSFVTTDGNAGTVQVPYAQYTPDQVSALVSARAAQLDAITALSSPPSR